MENQQAPQLTHSPQRTFAISGQHFLLSEDSDKLIRSLAAREDKQNFQSHTPLTELPVQKSPYLDGFTVLEVSPTVGFSESLPLRLHEETAQPISRRLFVDTYSPVHQAERLMLLCGWDGPNSTMRFTPPPSNFQKIVRGLIRIVGIFRARICRKDANANNTRA